MTIDDHIMQETNAARLITAHRRFSNLKYDCNDSLTEQLCALILMTTEIRAKELGIVLSWLDLITRIVAMLISVATLSI